jgi:hypothetical protein
MGIRTTLRHTCSAVFKCCIRLRRDWNKERQRKERNGIKEEEFAIYD